MSKPWERMSKKATKESREPLEETFKLTNRDLCRKTRRKHGFPNKICPWSKPILAIKIRNKISNWAFM